ncbi:MULTISPECIES: PepSY domain-containing protein [unclassified Arenibacter]|uniref:PepSY domain-containing protein n=1 Tax=unclassified Arenibacter TaxID=2615047 RepID=UPI000E355495|nr:MULTISPECIES: PepSY domain-containing protein [unclassified Arenibacter]MCM4165843.1 FAD-binding oxidoreductase [Arenibacter sp. A80]RFT54463.1 FAD-binding oxidoreductase [Arenibacter sp. P308M17]
MIVSVWRYSHLLFAIISSVFLLIASVTGVILAVEPISNKMEPYRVSGADELSLAETLKHINDKHEEVLSASRDRNGFVSITAIVDGKNDAFYVDPFTGEKLGDLIQKKPFFQFATNLHRSLFLKSTGRFLIGFASFLLILICISGIVLIAKRQGGYRQFFAPVVRENFSQYHHVAYARLSLITLLVLAITGVYLSMLRFEIIPDPQISLQVDFDAIQEEPVKDFTEFDLFKNTPLAALRELEYPFSEFVEDYYMVRLRDRELYLNQVTGEVLAEDKYPVINVISSWATVLHTGEGSILWSIVLGLGSLSIPFLTVTGFIVYFKRPKTKIKNLHSKSESEYVILTGTEGGTTLQFAQELHKQLLLAGKKTHIALMNQYAHFKKMEHLIVITATYGQGEAPSTADRFLQLVKKNEQKKVFNYSVVGFGSTAYPNFCQFAYEAHKVLKSAKNSTALHEVFTVNDQSFEAFHNWSRSWSEMVGLEVHLEKPKLISKPKPPSTFIVVDKTENSDDGTFLLNLSNQNGSTPRSGDLLSVVPADGARERLYSIGKLDKATLLISIRKHQKGLCSNYLYQFEQGEKLSATVVSNRNFHFPKNAKRTILIATGTGIGPFLGMIRENIKKREIYLYWGARTNNSFNLYQDYIESALQEGKLTHFKTAYSRNQPEKIYVQHLVQRDKDVFLDVLKNKGCIMICGSIAMQKEVLQELQQLCNEYLGKDLSHFQNRKQIKMDCY